MKSLLWIVCLLPMAMLLANCSDDDPTEPSTPKNKQLSIINHSFEDSLLADEDYTSDGDGLIGWTVPPDEADIGVFNPHIPDNFSMVPDGDQTAWCWGLSICQTLSDEIVEGATYVLTVEIGYNQDETYGGYSIQLRAGGSLLAEDNNTKTPPAGGWVTAQVEYVSPDGDPNAGEDIEICLVGLSSGGDETNFDNVRLEEQP